MDVEVNASGFSKDIKAFDDALEEMEKNKDQEEEDEEDTEESNEEEEEEEEKEAATTKKESKKEESSEGAVGGGEPSEITSPAENADAEEELYDKFDENLHLSNKQFRAYRDKTECELADSSEEDDDDDDRNSCSTTTSTIMDARTVRNKCRKSVLKKIKAERRRIRNKGESALITDRNRENNDNIKASIHFFN